MDENIQMYDYNDDSIEVIKEPIQMVREKYGMYIGYDGNRGFLHLIKEILQNAIDEVEAVSKSGNYSNEIFVDYDENSKKVIIEDQGRGIPLKKIIDVYTLLHSSGKYSKGESNAYQYAAGLNGVGATCANALSEKMVVTVCREGVKYRVKFIRGEVDEEGVVGNCTKTGTRVEFIPDESILGEITLASEEVMDLCRYMSYLSKAKFKFHATKIGKDGEINKTFVAENGVCDLVNLMCKKNRLIEPIHITDEDVENKIKVDIAFSYDPTITEEKIVSFANFCTTVDHGTHVIGMKNGITSSLLKYYRDNILDKDKKKQIEPISDDCRTGLVAVVNVMLENPRFIGQVKEKIENSELIPHIRNIVYRGVMSWIKDNQKSSKKLFDYIKAVAKTREEYHKSRKATIKTDATSFINRHKKYTPATGKEHLELYLIEGDSAAGPMKNGRDTKFQAMYAFKGVPLNTYEESLTKILDNDEMKGLVGLMGGIDDKFDLRKFMFEKVILCADADVDGGKIKASWMTFFLVHAPQIIEDGRLFIAVSPLYRVIKNGKRTYLNTKKEYMDMIEYEFTKKVEIRYLNGKKVSDEDLKDILYTNRRYLEMLKKSAGRDYVNPSLIEFILKNKDLKVKELNNVLKNKYRFMSAYENNNGTIVVEGYLNKESQCLLLNNKFYKKCEKIMSMIYEINKGEIYYIMNGNTVSLGELMEEFYKNEPKMKTRFKGLGELNADELWDTTLNPANRQLIQVTMEDAKKDAEKFRLLFSDKCRKERTAMMMEFEIDPEDLDT